jgi:lipopolysaccharide/colanic/teichoic acid biosynthesis glycosyltransferase
MYKLRTMVVDAEELKAKLHALNERDGPAFKIKNDPRVTSVGKFLRSTGIDELPQLWNILIGNMAIVGPRPLPCHEDAQCKTWQRRRLDTKPGLTCVWQISKSRDVSFEDWMRMDLQYSRKRSVRSDVTLVFKTVLAVFLGRVGH